MRILAVDYGDARTGLAVCDQLEELATPLETIRQRDPRKLAGEIVRTAEEKKAGRIVVGHPINMDGTVGPRARICQEFAETLRELSGLPVTLWDERQTSVAAAMYLNDMGVWGEKRKRVIDQVAAVLILESFLRWRKNHPGEEEPDGTL